jgi:hypothetical protein
MSALVIEASVAMSAAPGGRSVAVVSRRRRRGRWLPVEADAVVAAIDRGGSGAIVLARPPHADPGAAALVAVARLLGVPAVRLPADRAAADWVVATASHPDFAGDPLVPRLEVLVGAAAGPHALPRRPVDQGPAMPALRPGVLARWAGCAWAPCARCGGGGLAGADCGRCGAAGLGVTA